MPCWLGSELLAFHTDTPRTSPAHSSVERRMVQATRGAPRTSMCCRSGRASSTAFTSAVLQAAGEANSISYSAALFSCTILWSTHIAH